VKKKIERKGKAIIAQLLAPILGAGGRNVSVPSNVENLLVIRQQNQMGDMLLAVPAFRGIRKRFPGARITLLAAPINSSVMENNPYVDEVLTWSKVRSRRNPFVLLGFLRGLRRRRFDAVFVLGTVSFSVTSMLLAALSGARWRAGSSSEKFGSALTSRYYHLELPLPDEDELALMHESEHNLFPLRAIGIEEEDLSSVIIPFEWEERECGQFRAASFGIRPYAVIHPGAGKLQNIWPPERFAGVTDTLSRQHGIDSVAVRGPVDSVFFTRYLEACSKPPQVISCPSVGFLAALMRDAAVSICNDTGVAHIAGAVEARCIEIFGPTDPGRWKPVSDSVIAVRSPDGEIGSVKMDDVLEAVDRLLARAGPTGAGSG
jgi:ADP-heptose:LPS heptosyltransferase